MHFPAKRTAQGCGRWSAGEQTVHGVRPGSPAILSLQHVESQRCGWSVVSKASTSDPGKVDKADKARAQFSRKPTTSAAPLYYNAIQEGQYKALLEDLRGLPAGQWRAAAVSRPETTESGFLFWLSDQQRACQAAPEKEVLSSLCAELVFVREWQDYQANKLLLPSMASSLAYNNYQAWKTENPGAQAPEPVQGVSVEQLYRMSEKQETELQDGSSPWSVRSGPLQKQSGRERSSVDTFAEGNPAYLDLAAGAMARARARLMGYEDEGQVAVAQVLDVLLYNMYSREERATVLPDAFTPPGLELQSSPGRVCTTPKALLEEIAARAQRVSQQQQDDGGGSSTSSSRPQTETDAVGGAEGEVGRASLGLLPGDGAVGRSSAGSLGSSSGDAGGSMPAAAGPAAAAAAARQVPAQVAMTESGLLPSGETLKQVLAELEEDVREYNDHVYIHRSPLERYGRVGPW